MLNACRGSILRRRRLNEWNGRLRRAKQRDEHLGDVEVALASRDENATEDEI